MIDGVRLSTLQVIADERGAVLHMLKSTDPTFAGFGEMYFSRIAIGQRKAWRKHHSATSQLAVPQGQVLFALFDDRAASPSRGVAWDITLGESNYQLLTIPPGVWFAFHNVGSVEALIANCSSEPHDPSKVDRQDPTEAKIPYVWRD